MNPHSGSTRFLNLRNEIVIPTYHACHLAERSQGMRSRLLIIADYDTMDLISQVARTDSWAVYGADLGTGSLNTVLNLKPEAIILDAREPSDGFAEFCRTIRSIEGMATALLVALIRPGEVDYLDLLESGVDDCWSEATGTREFKVRLSGLHRRLHQAVSSRRIRRGDVELDLDRFTVRSNARSVQLTARQLNVLKYLMERTGVSVSNGELLERAWCNPELDEGAVRTCIKRLRQALSAAGAVNVIRNVSGGYLFDTEGPPLRIPWPKRKAQNDRSG